MKNLKILHIPDTCTGCGACASVCPRECIEMKADQDGFYFPVIDMEKCVECHACENGCHIISPSEAIPISKDNFYVYWTNDEILRQQSTSGGAFSLFAQYVIDQGGAVFASRYNGEMERLEVCNSDICGLEPQRKSKYIETYVGRAFAEIRDELKKGRWVLYCGTPCQAAGLRQHIKQMKTPSEKLIIRRNHY